MFLPRFYPAGIAWLGVNLVVAAVAVAASNVTGSSTARLPRSTPEAQGVASSAILAFVEAADTGVDTMNSFMLVRHGHVIAEGWWAPFTASDPHMMYSLSKSFTSTAVGIAAAEGKLTVDDTVISHFPEHAPAEPSANLRQMRMRDLLTMSTGHHAELIPTFRWGSNGEPTVREFLHWPVEHKPGTHFVYNTPATFMQSAIVQQVTGEKVVDYLGPRLFQPLGIGAPRWDETPDGLTVGGSGLHLRTEDIACFGQLYLQKGRWNDRQLVPAAWVEEATAKQTSNGSSPTSDWDQGYGYQFWRCRPGFYRGDGAHGQFCIVMPEQDTVVAITSGTRDMQGVMNIVWEKLLPALNATSPLPPDAKGEAALKKKLSALAVRGPADVAVNSPLAAQFIGRRYVLPANDRKVSALTLQQTTGGALSLVIEGDGYDGRAITIGHGAWQRGAATTRFGSDFDPRRRELRDEPVSALGGWETPDTFVARLCYHETPYILDVRLQFGGDIVVFNADYNVSFGNNAFPQLVGRAPAGN